MTDYRIIYEDPDDIEGTVRVVIPSDEWMKVAMSGGLPPINVYWALQDAEQAAIDEGRYNGYKPDPILWAMQFIADRIPPLTEEEAIEYLIMKDVPKRVWKDNHNRNMIKIVKKEQIPSDRSFRGAWRLSA